MGGVSGGGLPPGDKEVCSCTCYLSDSLGDLTLGYVGASGLVPEAFLVKPTGRWSLWL